MKRLYNIFWYWLAFFVLLFIGFIFFIFGNVVGDIVISSKTEYLRSEIALINNLLGDRLGGNGNGVGLADGLGADRLKEDLRSFHEFIPYNHLLVLSESGSFLYYGDKSPNKDGEEGGFPVDYSYKYKTDELIYDKDILIARDEGEGLDLRYYMSPNDSAVNRGRYLFYTVRFDKYYIRLAFSFSSLQSTINSIELLLFLLFFLVFIVFSFSALYFIRLIKQPIVELKGLVDRQKVRNGNKLIFSNIEEIFLLQKSVLATGTQLRKQFNELSRRRRQLETVIKYVSEGVLMLDGDLKVTMANRGIYSILGIKKELYGGGLRGRYYYEIIKDNEIISLIEQSVLEERKLKKKIDSYFLNDKVLDCSVTPLPKGVPGFVVFIDDITNVYDSGRLKSKFVNNVSYELQSPIAFINSNLNDLSSSMGVNSSKEHVFIDNISSSMGLISNFIRDLIVLNKLDDTDNNYFRRELFSVIDIIHSCISKLFSRANDRGIELISLIDEKSDIRLRASKELFDLVFSELINNALNYTQEGGNIKLSLSLGDRKELIFLITDTGVGIPLNERDKIFDRFYAVDKDYSRSLGGTGLGLSIVRSAMLSHYGGDVLCYDNPSGKGTEFKLIFPNSDNTLD